jgi:DNA processing protein
LVISHIAYKIDNVIDKIHTISTSSVLFPPLLREIHNPPKQLYIRGNIEVLKHPHTLAVVGSRQANVYGEQCIQKLLPPIIDAGVVIVSGLAYGIDSLSHQACTNKRLPTIAVLGSGINDSSIYPSSHLNLAHSIIKNDGAIISEYPPGTATSKSNFPARNRIVSGLCKATLLIQAAKRSGSLITARLALEQNRDVCVVPGPINDPLSAGTNNLLQQGATPILDSTDIFNILNIKQTKHDTPKNQKQLNLTFIKKTIFRTQSNVKKIKKLD